MTPRMPAFKVEIVDGPLTTTLTVSWQPRRGARWHTLHTISAPTPLRCLVQLGQWAEAEIEAGQTARAQVDNAKGDR